MLPANFQRLMQCFSSSSPVLANKICIPKLFYQTNPVMDTDLQIMVKCSWWATRDEASGIECHRQFASPIFSPENLHPEPSLLSQGCSGRGLSWGHWCRSAFAFSPSSLVLLRKEKLFSLWKKNRHILLKLGWFWEGTLTISAAGARYAADQPICTALPWSQPIWS